MKKLIKIMTMSLMMVVLFSSAVFAKEMLPIQEVAITGLDYPEVSSQLDTSVIVGENSYSYFMELNWNTTADGLYRVTIKTRTYYDYIYDENTIATINGNRATIIENEESRILTFSYTFPKKEYTEPQKGSSLTHKITVMYLTNGRISPNPIRAPHRKNTTVQIIPDEGYRVKDVVVDGESVGAVTTYTFKKVTETHKIKAYFEPIPGYVPVEKEEIVSGDIKEEVTYKFDDVTENDWFYEAVQFVCNNKLFNGVSTTEFAPNVKMTRGMIVTVLYRLAGEPATNKSIPFADVDMSKYYANAISWAKQNSIVNGIDDANFAPDMEISREQLVVILHRYAKLQGKDVSIGEETNILSYDDAFDVAEYAIPAFQWGCGAGIINGKTESTLAPRDFVTRAEVATMMMRFNKLNQE
jgi:hypothetical protein